MRENRVNKWFWIILAGWLFLVGGSFVWNSLLIRQAAFEQGCSEGRMAILKDMAYRLWNSQHGGLYVPVTAETPPNPYLKVPNRDVYTRDGLQLTLINPAAMSRHVFRLTSEVYGIREHLTSNNPLNPENAPDEWERRALTAFETDRSETAELARLDEKPYLRLMLPFVVDKPCLKCHAEQGYKEGDIRGGISVSIPMTAQVANIHTRIAYLGVAHLLFLLSGAALLFFSQKKIAGAFAAMEEAKAQANEERECLNVTLHSIADGVITSDLQGKIVLLNKIAEKLTGWSQKEAIGSSLKKIFAIIDEKTAQEITSPLERIISSGEALTQTNNAILLEKSGQHIKIVYSATPIFGNKEQINGLAIVFRDVSCEERLQEELLKIKKLESVGVLAGGIAHDFNNILTAIMGNIELALNIAESSSKTATLLSAAKKASERARNLTLQLLTFAKGGAPIKRITSIKEVIIDSTDFVLHGSPVSADFIIPDDLWLIEADPDQISQVIQNLVINARQAMPAGGKIRIECSNVTSVTSENTSSLANNSYVKITIQDNGCGIPEKLLEKLFDPYFTTKTEGSGLGLAICHSIVSKHGGHIYVKSQTGEGTVFSVFLPACEQEPHRESVHRKSDEPERSFKKARILVLDDDRSLLDLCATTLGSLGHEVLVAREGREAIEIYHEQMLANTLIDVVVMDLTIPGGMGGKEATQEILKMDPSARLVVTSGYHDDTVMTNYKKFGFLKALIKPFSPAELEKIVNDLIDTDKSRPALD